MNFTASSREGGERLWSLSRARLGKASWVMRAEVGAARRSPGSPERRPPRRGGSGQVRAREWRWAQGLAVAVEGAATQTPRRRLCGAAGHLGDMGQEGDPDAVSACRFPAPTPPHLGTPSRAHSPQLWSLQGWPEGPGFPGSAPSILSVRSSPFCPTQASSGPFQLQSLHRVRNAQGPTAAPAHPCVLPLSPQCGLQGGPDFLVRACLGGSFQGPMWLPVIRACCYLPLGPGLWGSDPTSSPAWSGGPAPSGEVAGGEGLGMPLPGSPQGHRQGSFCRPGSCSVDSTPCPGPHPYLLSP